MSLEIIIHIRVFVIGNIFTLILVGFFSKSLYQLRRIADMRKQILLYFELFIMGYYHQPTTTHNVFF